MVSVDTKKQAGFGMGAIIVATLMVAVLGLIGWQLYSTYSKPGAQKNTSSGTTGSGKGDTQTRATDPYAEWKTYCDTVEKACFKYPANWTIRSSSQNGITSAILTSPSGSVVANYASSDTRDGTEVAYYTASIDDTTTVSTLKVVGGFIPASADVTPRYKVVDQSSATNLAVNQETSSVNTARFSFRDHTTGRFEAYPINTSFDTDQAKAWFSSDDAKTLLLIEKSFYLE